MKRVKLFLVTSGPEISPVAGYPGIGFVGTDRARAEQYARAVSGILMELDGTSYDYGEDAADAASWRDCARRADYANAAQHAVECPEHGWQWWRCGDQCTGRDCQRPEHCVI